MDRSEAQSQNRIILLKKQLPYLGEEVTEHDFQKEPSIRSYRPDYNAFKSKVYNTELSCAEVIVGVCILNDVYTFHKEICLKIIEKGGSEDEPTVLNHNSEYVYSGGIYCLLTNIREIIDLGIESGDIGKVIVREPHPLEKNDLFKRTQLFHSLSFLRWMKLNGFPTPDELTFYEDENGKLEYAKNSNLNRSQEIDQNNTEAQNEFSEFNNSNKFNRIDWSNRTRREQAVLANSWKAEGLSNRQIAERLFKDKWEAGLVKKDSLIRRVKRLRTDFPNA